MIAQGVDILLVEDNSSDVDLTLHALRHNGVANRICVVRGGEEALKFIFCRESSHERTGKPAPQIVLLDSTLPKVDAAEVLRQIKNDERTRLIPVVILTSFNEDRESIKVRYAKATGLIHKPVDFAQFRALIAQLGLYWLVVNEPSLFEQSQSVS